MKKNGHKSRRLRQKRRETILLGVVGGILILVMVLGIVNLVIGGRKTGYTVTVDGHIHAHDGTHVGTVEEILGENRTDVVVTEDGHVHAADGTHLGSIGEKNYAE